MTTTSPSTSRRGLAITSLVLGAVAALMILAFWITLVATEGDGLSNATLLAIFFYYGSPVVGAIAVLVGIAAVFLARPRLFGIIGIILGAVPIVVVAAAFAAGSV